MTIAEFVKASEAAFIKNNPTALVVGWVKRPKHITYPTGLRGIYGTFQAVADGYKPSIMLAAWDQTGGLMVR